MKKVLSIILISIIFTSLNFGCGKTKKEEKYDMSNRVALNKNEQEYTFEDKPTYSNYMNLTLENGNITETARKQVEGMLKTQFRPEFLNRLDEIVFYKPLTRNEIDKIVDLQVADLNRRLSDKQLTMRLTPAARSYIVAQGYDPIYGARPLKRFMQRSVETLIARKLIAEDVQPRTDLLVDYDGDKLVIDAEPECTVS